MGFVSCGIGIKEVSILLQRVQVYFENAYIATPVYMLDKLRAGHTIEGPAIILDKNRYGFSSSLWCYLMVQFSGMKVGYSFSIAY